MDIYELCLKMPLQYDLCQKLDDDSASPVQSYVIVYIPWGMIIVSTSKTHLGSLQKWTETHPEVTHTKGIKYATPTLSEVINRWPQNDRNQN